jgi:putative membrane protein
MELLFQIIFTPVVILVSAKMLSGIYIKDFKAAFWTSLSILIVGFLVGWFLTLLLNLATLGLFWIVGLGVITRIIAYAVVIEVVDKVSDDFHTKGFLPSLWLSILLAVTWGIIDYIF